MGAAKSKVRGRINYNTRENYKKYKLLYPTSDVTYYQFLEIIGESNKAIRDCILENPLGFKLPYSIGYVAVDKFKPGKRLVPVDWVTTVKLGRIIPRTNFHSFGYVYKVKLFKNPSCLPILAYNMNAHRVLKRMLAQNIINDTQQYIEIDRTYYSRRFRIDRIIKQ